MDMRIYAKTPIADIETYKAVMCYELAGKTLKYTMDGGEKLSLSFAAFPTKEVQVNGSERGLIYDCMKSSPHVLFISYVMKEACAVYVLDMDAGLITRIVSDEKGRSSISFGASGDGKERHAYTQDMNENIVDWFLGPDDASVFRIEYSDEGVSVTRPRAGNVPALEIQGFQAVKITKNIYLQNTAVQFEGRTITATMVANHWNLTCVGSVYGASAGKEIELRRYAGYGRFARD